MFENLKYQDIGVIRETGDVDEYVLITNLDEDFQDLDLLYQFLLQKYSYYRGLSFCSSIALVRTEYREDQVICTIYHRLDI